jgi:hypothetical protein
MLTMRKVGKDDFVSIVCVKKYRRRTNVAMVVADFVECLNSVDDLGDHEVDSRLIDSDRTGQNKAPKIWPQLVG